MRIVFLEEVLLENVELILEAFDYLQLPFALNQGRVGKLSIKIPWKKPWDPIIIILEDVFISASKRDDHEVFQLHSVCFVVCTYCIYYLIQCCCDSGMLMLSKEESLLAKRPS
jgi:hypothetical protein